MCSTALFYSFQLPLKWNYFLMEPDYSLIPEAELKEITNKDSVNINVGVLGHVDSGKTSICRVLS